MSEGIKKLLQSIFDYLWGIKIAEARDGGSKSAIFSAVLIEFAAYAMRENTPWKDLFTYETFILFRKDTHLKKASPAIIGLSEYLHQKTQIEQPLKIPSYQVKLPAVYEQYLFYLDQVRGICQGYINSARRVLASLHDYLEKQELSLAGLKIEHLDALMMEFKVAKTTLKTYRHLLRGFLKYLYAERKIIKQDLAPLVVGPPRLSYQKPPKFLRPQEIKTLFSSLKLSTPVQIRTYAMIHLAYSLGLRPIEISRLTLDDISFTKAELTVRERKTNKPAILPLPQQTVKAIAAYVLKARQKTEHRALFMTHNSPHSPVCPGTVIGAIRTAMREAGLSSSAYWLRHTYAQNLLGIGRSIYEIKEMMGHQNIQSTQRYLCVDTERMRKVLFNETL
jgi:integrase/recombinase XerD